MPLDDPRVCAVLPVGQRLCDVERSEETSLTQCQRRAIMHLREHNSLRPATPSSLAGSVQSHRVLVQPRCATPPWHYTHPLQQCISEDP
eukprot:306336-Amphidinium_carterae.1